MVSWPALDPERALDEPLRHVRISLEQRLAAQSAPSCGLFVPQ